jgi:membrane-bound serine protease (ClpP class)
MRCLRTLSLFPRSRPGEGAIRRHGRRLRTLAAGLLSLCLAATSVARQDEQPATTPKAAPPTTAASVPASRQADNVAVITIRGEIDQWTAVSVRRRMDHAVANGAGAVVFEIDTPGGAVGAMLDITNLIKNSPISNTVAWIHPKAYSAGAFIALACNEVVVSQSATMGDAAPIAIGPMGLMALPETERQKMLAPLLTELTDSARRNGYDEKLVQAFVMLGVELWLVEHAETGRRLFIDEREYRTLFDGEPLDQPMQPSGAAPSARTAPTEVGPPAPGVNEPQAFRPVSPAIDAETAKSISDDLADLGAYSTRPILTRADKGQWRLVEHVTDGTTLLTLSTPDLVRYGLAQQVVTNDAELKAFFGATNLSRLDPTWSEHLARFLSLMPVKGFLIVVFLLGLFLEMSAPGVGLPGGVALAALMGLLAPQFVAGAAAWWGVLALVSGIAFLGLELFVLPGFGVFGVLGLVALFAGLLGMVIGPGPLFPDSDAEKQDLIYGVTTVLLALCTTFIGMYFITKYHRSLPVLSKLVLANEPRPFADDEADGMLGAMGGEAAAARVGEEGVAITTLRPSGTAEFGERLVDVVSEIGMIDQGTRVRVTRVNGNRVAVEPMDDPDGGLFGDLPAGSADDGGKEIA